MIPYKNTASSNYPSTAQLPSEGESSTEDSTAITGNTTSSGSVITDSDYDLECENSTENQSCFPFLNSHIVLHLLEEKIWKNFYTVGNEMIVNRPGR